MDERLRSAARVLDTSDATAVQRFVDERARFVDPLEKLAGLIERARLLYADRHFALGDVLAIMGHARVSAKRSAKTGHPMPGYLWVKGCGHLAKLHKFSEPEHAPDFREPDSGVMAMAMCRACGAEGIVAGRCVLPTAEGEGIDRSEVATSWWRGSRSEHEVRRVVGGGAEGVRHFALAYWDGDAGIVAVEVRTGTSTQRVSSVIPIMKKTRSEAYRPISRDRMRAWALAEDEQRVVMTIRYAERAGTDGRALWDADEVKERRNESR